MAAHFLKGLIIGFAVAAPVGPIALLVMRRALTEGRFAAIVSGLGAATADVVCGSIAALGLSAVTSAIEQHHSLLQLFGGIFMVLLGLHTMRSMPKGVVNRPVHERNWSTAYFSTFLLTLVNPLTLIGLTGVIAAAGVGGEDSTLTQAAFLVGGIFLGSCAWWLLLSTASDWLGRRLGPNMLPIINRSAGFLIVAFGAWQLIESAHRWR